MVVEDDVVWESLRAESRRRRHVSCSPSPLSSFGLHIGYQDTEVWELGFGELMWADKGSTTFERNYNDSPACRRSVRNSSV